jgi:hypothetical protein
MNILGFSITRKSKRVKELEQLSSFKHAVYGIHETVKLFSDDLASFNFSFQSYEQYGLYQRALESFLDVYISSPFSMPSNAFKLTELVSKCHEALSGIAKTMEMKKNWDEHKDVLSEAFKGNDFITQQIKAGMKQSKQEIINACVSNLNAYTGLLTAIEFVIKYDLVRVTCEVDILEQYHTNKKLKKVPESEFVIHFKRLSKEEIDKQKEDEDNESNRNRI